MEIAAGSATGKRLAGLNGNHVLISADGGVNWAPFGPPAPFNSTGLTYSEKGKCFYVWQLVDNLKRPPVLIARLAIR